MIEQFRDMKVGSKILFKPENKEYIFDGVSGRQFLFLINPDNENDMFAATPSEVTLP
ncbi:hypothetical protein [Halobacillus litoralis]|uniref:hypothetical protein n=1 Tax=Halobacillus litoralis TaxID=45668 RepID=UPI001CD72A86|nr:hypothetical protein [Halobacillus litoralis]MCA1021601.1 hypothetical protein [Halobacillus litoralis]